MITSPLLSNVRHRAMIMPLSPLSTEIIHISPRCWTIFYSFETILKMGTAHKLEFKCDVLFKSTASINIQSDMNYVSKKYNCIAQQLGLYWMSPRKARENACYEPNFFVRSPIGRNEGGKGGTVPWAPNHYGGAEGLRRAPQIPNNVTSTLFNRPTVY